MLYGGIREVKEKTRSALFFRGMGDFPHVSGLIQYWHLIFDSATRCGGGKYYAIFGELD